MARPTDYKPEYDEMLITHMSEGMSYESFAGKIGAYKQTLYNWEKSQPTFLDAKREAWEKSRYFWEKIGVGGAVGKVNGFNVTAWIFNMKNRFGWRDRTDINVSEVKPTIIKRRNGDEIELGMSGTDGERHEEDEL